ncbi:spermidine/putrescine transport system permease protein [Mycoplasmoides fastidiosum]|uniref:Spermidine/putrescine transport system permease protein n=1 Tax=Mycoplasmoides fastidiosum TaxID=92758 RepID=A0ABU0LYT1_9BACT|nr:ABC transporter permease [Mycoplasmoides fastidiosum]MDQ0513867.1 spermidine/putrescine transport system permease protein [Mycoplasmoides fastidiosum]UUD37719.1 ABC transporter permease [Mycoplasmoides fastidiosum]
MFKTFLANFFTQNRFFKTLKMSYIWVVLALIYIPLIIVVFLSFTDPSVRGNVVLNFERNWNSGENFSRLFVDLSYNGNFISSLVNSIIIAAIVTPISLVIGTLTTFGIWRAKEITKANVLNVSKITIINPDVITGISLSTLFVIAFLPLGLNFGWVTIILAQISFTVPYVIVTLYPKMMKMNIILLLASYDLNYRKFETFIKIVVPYLMPSIFGATLIAFAVSFDDFIITNLVRGRVTTIATELYTMSKGIKSWAITFGALIVLITLGIIALLSIFKIVKTNRNKLSPRNIIRSFKKDDVVKKHRGQVNTFEENPMEMMSRAE